MDIFRSLIFNRSVLGLLVGACIIVFLILIFLDNSRNRVINSTGFLVAENNANLISKLSNFYKNESVIAARKKNDLPFLINFFNTRIWSKHISNQKTNCIKTMNILKYLNNRKYGFNTAKLLTIYRTLIESKINYGCQIYSTAFKSTLKNLDSIHNSCLRLCTGAFRTAPQNLIL